jgi:hypothetical protein
MPHSQISSKFVISFSKIQYIFEIWELSSANSFWNHLTQILFKVMNLLVSDSYPAFFLPIATSSNKNF